MIVYDDSTLFNEHGIMQWTYYRIIGIAAGIGLLKYSFFSMPKLELMPSCNIGDKPLAGHKALLSSVSFKGPT